jgi:hypothetical protein
MDFLRNVNTFTEKSGHKELDSDKGSKEMEIVPCRAIYLARKYNRKQFKNVDLKNFSISRMRRIWKEHSEKMFRLFVEGKAMNELFC